ncbi:MAG: restriction endonuclease [Chloroflexota bacterium]
MKLPFATRRKKRPLTPQMTPIKPLTSWMLLVLFTAVFAGWLAFRRLWQPAIFDYFPQFSQEFLPILELTGALTLLVLWFIHWWYRFNADELVSKPKMTVEQLYALSPAEFEEYVGQIFQKRGYKVQLRGRSGDMGVDIEVRRNTGKKAVVQCKRYKHTVGPETIRELYGTLIHERASHAFLVTTAEISDAAQQWAKGKPMTLIDGKTLVEIAASLDNE